MSKKMNTESVQHTTLANYMVNMSSCLPCPTHYLEPMWYMFKYAPNFVSSTRNQRLFSVFFYSSLLCSSEKFLQPVWRRQVPNSVASLTSFAGCYFLPTVLVMTTCFDPEFCFLRLIWVFFPSCVLLRTDLTWLFLGVCVLSTHHRVQRVLEMQCT